VGKCRIEYLQIAISDLEDVFAFVSDNSPQAAMQLIDRIDSSIARLESFPEMGLLAKPPRLARKGYRVLIIDEILVFYVVFGDVVEIRRILSGKRNYAHLV
jgi:addiction module RelE/StbE family toxin